MTFLIAVFVVAGAVPLIAGLLPLITSGQWQRQGWDLPLLAASTLSCVLAFNLVFFWQELWLVLPKAWTPGLSPVLYHNDHGWQGHVPAEELLQGTGALAILLVGVAALLALRLRRAALGQRPVLWLLLFWLAFEGLFQALLQVVIGAGLSGNDVGRAMSWLQLPVALRWLAAALALATMAVCANQLSRLFPMTPESVRGSRVGLLRYAVIPAFLAVPLIVPFRVPREVVEVAFVPLLVSLTGSGWLLAAAAGSAEGTATRVRWPLQRLALLLVGLLLVFQLLLRPGIRF